MNAETWALEYKVAGQSACGNGYMHAVCNMQGKAFQPSFRKKNRNEDKDKKDDAEEGGGGGVEDAAEARDRETWR